MKRLEMSNEQLKRVAGFMEEKLSKTAQTYEGFSNWETWSVALELTNDYGTYEYHKERIQELREEEMTPEEVVQSLSSELESSFEEFAPEVDGIYQTLLNASMREIDWGEVAQQVYEMCVDEGDAPSY